MSTATATPRVKSSKKNLRRNMKIMDKDYHLVNSKTKEFVTVHPPKSMLPGMNADGKQPKDDAGRWIRVFSVEDSNHVKSFNRKRTVILRHLPGEVASYDDEDGNVWSLVPIEGVHASKPRLKKRKGVRARSTVRTQKTKRLGPGRPKGSKNKVEAPKAETASAATANTKDTEPIEVTIPK